MSDRSANITVDEEMLREAINKLPSEPQTWWAPHPDPLAYESIYEELQIIQSQLQRLELRMDLRELGLTLSQFTKGLIL